MPQILAEEAGQVLAILVPAIAGVMAVVSIAAAVGKLKLKFGSRSFGIDRTSAEAIRERLKRGDEHGGPQQYALLREYHAQGLSQSRISFWFSLGFASIGFAVIALSIGIFLQQTKEVSGGWLDAAGKPIFTLVAGTIIDAVSALFFVQSNKARQLMTEFFDKLRIDRKLDESLKLANAVDDTRVASNLKALLSLHFAEVGADATMFGQVISNYTAVSVGETAQPSRPSQSLGLGAPKGPAQA